MTKLCIIETKVEYCNHSCPHFHHNYDDKENCYCGKLNKKVYDFGYDPDVYEDVIMFDKVKRPIPSECPLQDI